MTNTYQNIQIKVQSNVAIINLNRPKVLNALSHQLMEELISALEDCDHNDDIGAIVLTGNERAFAAGADIKEMADETAVSILCRDQFATWDRIKLVKKPIIAAVSGFALGGGCELALSCDMIIASETAQFGQPEISIGVIPGAGGTQRLTKILGKYKAMELILTGRPFTAREAFQLGMVNKVVPIEIYLEEAVALATEIAKRPMLAVRLAKESILKSFETTLAEGLQAERKNFYLLFSSADQKEGMHAFMEKRVAQFVGR